MVDNTKVLAVLKRGREYVEKGWTQRARIRMPLDGQTLTLDAAKRRCGGKTPDPGTFEVCVMGAIEPALDAVDGDDFDFVELTNTAIEHLEQFCPANSGLITFNDYHDTEQSHVLSLFDKAIAAVEQEVAS